MKKGSHKLLIAGLTAAVLSALLLAGCGQTPPDGTGSSQPMSGGTIADDIDPNAFMNEILPHLNCLDSCDQEVFGADVDWDTTLRAGHVSAEDHTVGVLYPDGDPLPAGFAEDPGAAAYYPIRNYTSIQEVYAWMEQYMTPELAKRILPDTESVLLEFEGKLYLCRGSRGYGTFQMAPDSLSYCGEKGGHQMVSADYLAFGEYDHSVWLCFDPAPDGWQLSDIQIIEDAVG